MAESKIINGYQGQITSIIQPESFVVNENIFDKIIEKEAEDGKNYVIQRLGIQALPGTVVKLNSISVKIGKTGIYEIDDVEITSIKLQQALEKDMTIDYILKQTGGE